MDGTGFATYAKFRLGMGVGRLRRTRSGKPAVTL